MNKNIIILIIVLLVIGILIGYFLLPVLVKSLTTTGGNVFGSSSGMTPPTMP
jgi:flagellar basal body-associated protein FliL